LPPVLVESLPLIDPSHFLLLMLPEVATLCQVILSLAAIKKLVFDEERISFFQLRQALQSNFMAPEGESIRRLSENAPKFGNDDDYVDSITADVFNLFARKVQKYRASRGGQLAPTSQTITMNLKQGEVVGATPDGRKAGETVADNTSPAPGVDNAGPTAV